MLELEFKNLSQVLACHASAWNTLDAILSSSKFSALRKLVLKLSPWSENVLGPYIEEESCRDFTLLLGSLLSTLHKMGITVVDLGI